MRNLNNTSPARVCPRAGPCLSRARGGHLAALFLCCGALSGALSGCATWSPETRALEAVWQGTKAVDAAQTLRVAREPAQFHEAWAAGVIGAQPSEASVCAFMGAQMAAHWLVTDYLERRASPLWLRRTWQVVGITYNGVTITHNLELGLYP